PSEDRGVFWSRTRSRPHRVRSRPHRLRTVHIGNRARCSTSCSATEGSPAVLARSANGGPHGQAVVSELRGAKRGKRCQERKKVSGTFTESTRVPDTFSLPTRVPG